MKYKIITTKSTYWSEDRKQVGEILVWMSKNNYGKKPNFPIFTDIEGRQIAVNPQYVVVIERYDTTSSPTEVSK